MRGSIKISSLSPNTTYLLQIIANSNPIKVNEGDICVRIDESSKSISTNPLSLNLSTECLHGVLTRVNYSTSGGKGNISYVGPSSNELFLMGA